MNVTTITIQPYGSLNIHSGETVAYLNGNAPYIYLRLGSDSIKVIEGQCVPTKANFVQIINPYPREIEISIGRGFPVQFGPAPRGYTDAQMDVVFSATSRIISAATQTPGTRWGIGMLMKRGSAVLKITDFLGGYDTKVVVFRGASPAFLNAKPNGAFMLGPAFRETKMDFDNAVYSVTGEYTEAHIAAWIAAAGYTGQVIEAQHFNERSYVVTSEDAVFLCRYNTSGFDARLGLYHLGANLGEFD